MPLLDLLSQLLNVIKRKKTSNISSLTSKAYDMHTELDRL